MRAEDVDLAHDRAALVLVEVALSVMLLIGAGLLVRSFLKLQQVDLGFRSERTLAITVSPPSATASQSRTT